MDFCPCTQAPGRVTNIHRFSDSSHHCASPPPDMGQTPWYHVVQTKIAAKRGASQKKMVKIGLNPSRRSQCIDGTCPVFQTKTKQYDGRVQNLWITQNLDEDSQVSQDQLGEMLPGNRTRSTSQGFRNLTESDPTYPLVNLTSPASQKRQTFFQ